MQVFQHHHAAVGAGHAAQETKDPFGQHEHGVVDLGNRVVAPRGDEPAQGRAEGRELGGVGTCAGAHGGVEHLGQRAVRDRRRRGNGTPA